MRRDYMSCYRFNKYIYIKNIQHYKAFYLIYHMFLSAYTFLLTSTLAHDVMSCALIMYRGGVRKCIR
jgi:hypothetical protein